MTANPYPDFRVDLFCIGAPKSRTTWLAHCLDDHPEISIAAIKENGFFVDRRGVFTDDVNEDFCRDWAWYRSLYVAAQDGNVLGDFSIDVWRNPESASRAISANFPNAKLLVSLRDPVKRLYSHYWFVYARMRHWGGVPKTFEEAVKRDDFLDRSRYARRLKLWLEHFDASQMHVVTDIDLDADTGKQIRNIYSFLDVEKTFIPSSMASRINPPRGRRGIYGTLFRTSQRLRRAGMGPLIDLGKRLGGERAVDRLDWRYFEYPPLDGATDQRVRALLFDDIEQLEGMLDRDLTPWKDGTVRDDSRLSAPRAEQRIQFNTNASRNAQGQPAARVRRQD